MVAGLYAAWSTATIAGAWVPVSMLALGVVVPIAYNSLVRKRPLSEMGIGRKHWLGSLVLGLVLSVLVAMAPSPTVTFMDAVKALTPAELLPLLALEITAGLFWVIFFQGWVQMRFERAFGAIPAIVIAAAFFALHHAAYGESLSLSHMAPLFMAGVVNAAVFRMTRNILALWPFFISTTGLSSDLMVWNLRLPLESAYGYVGVLILMWSFISIVYLKQKEKGEK
jgi:membrane protease YdiL (CAAX protease family)